MYFKNIDINNSHCRYLSITTYLVIKNIIGIFISECEIYAILPTSFWQRTIEFYRSQQDCDINAFLIITLEICKK